MEDATITSPSSPTGARQDVRATRTSSSVPGREVRALEPRSCSDVRRSCTRRGWSFNDVSGIETAGRSTRHRSASQRSYSAVRSATAKRCSSRRESAGGRQPPHLRGEGTAQARRSTSSPRTMPSAARGTLHGDRIYSLRRPPGMTRRRQAMRRWPSVAPACRPRSRGSPIAPRAFTSAATACPAESALSARTRWRSPADARPSSRPTGVIRLLASSPSTARSVLFADRQREILFNLPHRSASEHTAVLPRERDAIASSPTYPAAARSPWRRSSSSTASCAASSRTT